MTAKDVLDEAGMFLREEKILNREPDDAGLLRLVGSVVSEISSEYYPLKAEEEAESGGEIPLASLSKRVRQILRVTRDGRAVEFSLHPFCIRTVPGRVRILYHYEPAAVEEELSALELSPLLTVRAVALGVAAEFCLMHNLYEQAVMFDQKFRESLAALAPRRGIRLPARGLT